MTHFFISYAKKDTRELALALSDHLNTLPGVTAWVDRSLRAGQAWELQIQREIDRCDQMIVLYSPDLNRHKHGEPESYVLTEIAYAKYTAGKPIIPVMVQMTAAPISLTMLHYIDFTLPGLTLADLVTALCDEAGIVVGSAPTPVVKSPPAPPPTPRRIVSKVPDILPGPFAWIDIPGKGYSIAKYPVTNAQFAKFIEAEGYNQPNWWTTEGWQKREEGWHYDGGWKPSRKAWTEPRYWRENRWNGAEQPVVGISWFEAVAFCLWLRDATGEKVMLPTEDQWQYAAQGDDGREFPWGNTWDCARCNNSVKPCDRSVTTPVRQYEGKVDSPFGVVDMAGNVWEWCLTDYANGMNDIKRNAENRVLRGGSWHNSNPVQLRCAFRFGYFPFNRSDDWGFRLALS